MSESIVDKKDAYTSIKEMIFSREIAPGTIMVERRLAEQLGISRVPVREALKRLVFEGILVREPAKGLVARIYTEQDVLDLYAFREPLDGTAAGLFAARADEVEIGFLGSIFQGLVEHYREGRIESVHHADFEFHRTIARGSRNRRLAEVLDDLYEECLYVTQSMYVRSAEDFQAEQREAIASELVQEHQAIFDAVTSGDPERAEHAARASVRTGISRFMRNFADGRVKAM